MARLQGNYKFVRLSAGNVKTLYSPDANEAPGLESSNWHADFEDGTDYYMSLSYDDGVTWGAPIKVVGEDGKDAKSVEINVPNGNSFINGTPESLTLTARCINFIGTKFKWKKDGKDYTGHSDGNDGEIVIGPSEYGVYEVEVADPSDNDLVYKDVITILSVRDGENAVHYNCSLSMSEIGSAVEVSVTTNGTQSNLTYYCKDYYGTGTNGATTQNGGVITLTKGKGTISAIADANKHLINVYKDKECTNLLVSGFVSYGENGQDSSSYWNILDRSSLHRRKDGKLENSTITATAYRQSGSGEIGQYQGKFKFYVYTSTPAGKTFTQIYGSSSVESSHKIDLIRINGKDYSTDTSLIGFKVELYLADGKTLVDADIIDVINDGADGPRGSLEFYGTEINTILPDDTAYTLTTASIGITSDMEIRVDDTYVNTITNDVWTCVKEGSPTTAQWRYMNRASTDEDDSNVFRFFTPNTHLSSVSTGITAEVITEKNPFGNSDNLLRVYSGATSKAGSSRLVPYSKSFKVDPTKDYRYVCYVKQITNNNTADYFGIRGYTANGDAYIQSLSGDAVNSAYFTSSKNFGTAGKWYMIVGYVMNSSAKAAPSDAGIYDIETKLKLTTSVTNYKWKSGITKCEHTGTLIGYNSSASSAAFDKYIYDVRFDKLDGDYPSIDDLLRRDTSTRHKGEWKTGIVYNENNIVSYKGGSYYCIKDHTSTDDNSPLGTQSSTYWNLIATSGKYYFAQIDGSNQNINISVDMDGKVAATKEVTVTIKAFYGSESLTAAAVGSTPAVGKFAIKSIPASINDITVTKASDSSFKITATAGKTFKDTDFTVTVKFPDESTQNLVIRVSKAGTSVSEEDLSDAATAVVSIQPKTFEVVVNRKYITPVIQTKTFKIKAYKGKSKNNPKITNIKYDTDQQPSFLSDIKFDKTNPATFSVIVNANRSIAATNSTYTINFIFTVELDGVTEDVSASLDYSVAMGENHLGGYSDASLITANTPVLRWGDYFTYTGENKTSDSIIDNTTSKRSTSPLSDVEAKKYLDDSSKKDLVVLENGEYYLKIAANVSNKKLIKGCVYTWKTANTSSEVYSWYRDTDTYHISQCLNETITALNTKLSETPLIDTTLAYREIVTGQLYADMVFSNDVFTERLVANSAYIKALGSTEITLYDKGVIKSDIYTNTKGFKITGDGKIYARELYIGPNAGTEKSWDEYIKDKVKDSLAKIQITITKLSSGNINAVIKLNDVNGEPHTFKYEKEFHTALFSINSDNNSIVNFVTINTKLVNPANSQDDAIAMNDIINKINTFTESLSNGQSVIVVSTASMWFVAFYNEVLQDFGNKIGVENILSRLYQYPNGSVISVPANDVLAIGTVGYTPGEGIKYSNVAPESGESKTFSIPFIQGMGVQKQAINGKDGKNGKDGAPGEPGEPGKDALPTRTNLMVGNRDTGVWTRPGNFNWANNGYDIYSWFGEYIKDPMIGYYTISCDMMATTTSGTTAHAFVSPIIRWEDSDGTEHHYHATERHEASNRWGHYSCTMYISPGGTPSIKYMQAAISIGNDNKDNNLQILVRNVKIEYGEEETPFCYAPQDLIGSANDIQGLDALVSKAQKVYHATNGSESAYNNIKAGPGNTWVSTSRTTYTDWTTAKLTPTAEHPIIYSCTQYQKYDGKTVENTQVSVDTESIIDTKAGWIRINLLNADTVIGRKAEFQGTITQGLSYYMFAEIYIRENSFQIYSKYIDVNQPLTLNYNEGIIEYYFTTNYWSLYGSPYVIRGYAYENSNKNPVIVSAQEYWPRGGDSGCGLRLIFNDNSTDEYRRPYYGRFLIICAKSYFND